MKDKRIKARTKRLALLLGFTGNKNERITQTALQCWLRESHSLLCIADETSTYALITGVGYYAKVVKVNKDLAELNVLYYSFYFYDTYEEALELALFEALYLLKTNNYEKNQNHKSGTTGLHGNSEKE